MRHLPILTIVSAAVLLSGCQKQEQKTSAASEPPPVTAPVLTLTEQPFQPTITVTGTLISNTRVDIKAETIGRITKFQKEEGDSVAAGEAIVWVNDENYRIALRQAQTALSVAEYALERARLLESHSRSELERAENLLKSGGITDKDLKAAQLAERDSKAQTAVASAQVDQARAAVESAEKRIRDTVIHSPVAGVIQKKFVNPGAYVEAPTALFTVVDNSRLELSSPVAAADLAAIRTGQPVRFTVNSYPGETFSGRVLEIAPEVEAETRSVKVRVAVSNPGGKLKAGMFAEGEVLTGATVQALIVPASAVYRDDRSAKSSYVFVLADGKATRRQVRIGHEMPGKLVINEGLKPGDVVISEQSIEIADGVRVTPRS